MIFQKLQVRVFLQLTSSILFLYLFSGCIDQCDTTNSTKLNMAFVDATGKAVSFRYQMYNEKNERLDTLKAKQTSDKAFLFLDLSKSSTSFNICLFPDPALKDSVCEQITFNYTLLPFNKGPECGIDLKVQDLSVTHTSDPAGITNSVKVINNELSTGNTTNVLIYTSK
ncbi:MAG TPA: hypothetical protein VD908_15125 [Cytophagales bacterium]|nr:hypothetical protein [Cytophagales bacterium]